MTASATPQGQPSTGSPLVDALLADEGIDGLGARVGDQVPGWLQRSTVPEGWRLVGLADHPGVPLARLVLRGPLDDGEWEGTETISVFGYTGRPMFYDVFSNAAGALRNMGATNIVTSVLSIPPAQGAAALRSRGAALTGDRRVWAQQSTYVAGSDQPQSGRLIVHSLFVDARCWARLAEDIMLMSNAVHQGFVAALRATDRPA